MKRYVHLSYHHQHLIHFKNDDQPLSYQHHRKYLSLYFKTITLSTSAFLGCREGHRGHDRMVVRFTTTCAMSAYHHKSCEFEPCSWQGVLDTIIGDKVCQ